jgi:hypothetical protein
VNDIHRRRIDLDDENAAPTPVDSTAHDQRIWEAFCQVVSDLMENPDMTQADAVAALKKAVLDD